VRWRTELVLGGKKWLVMPLVIIDDWKTHFGRSVCLAVEEACLYFGPLSFSAVVFRCGAACARRP